MQRISVTRLSPGMIVARSVYDADGRVLIASEIELRKNYIERLIELGIGSIYVQADALPQVDIPEVVKEETRMKAIHTVKSSFQNFQTTKRIDLKQFTAVAASIVEDIIGNRDTLVHLTDIRTYDDYTFAHSVNVCILSVIMGISKNYNECRLKELSLGALLHDIGKVLVPIEILNNPGRLTPEEFIVVQNHTDIGFEILRKQQDQIPLLACHVAYQHHEKIDGSGYPRRLKGEQIHEYARIVAIADVYDALTSDRPYRKGLLPHDAYEVMMASGDRHFESELLHDFFNKIAVYPLGSIVRLNTGGVGVVIDVLPGLSARPKIQLIMDHLGNYLQEIVVVDLTIELTVFVDKVYNDEETHQWLQN